MAPPTFGELTGATKSDTATGAVDELARALRGIDFSNIASGADALTTAQRDLSNQLKVLQDQAEQNIDATKRQLREGKISGDKASKIISQQNKAIERLNKAVEAETKGKMAGVKEYEKLLAATKDVNKEFEWTRENIRKNRMLDRQWYREQARRTKQWAKASERIDEFNSALEGVQGKLGTEYLGQGIVNRVQESLKSRAQRKGAGRGIRTAATAGVVGGAAAALLSKLVDIRQQALAIVAPKVFNYGLQGLADLDEKILSTQRNLTDFKKEASLFGVELETAVQIFGDLGKATGETDENIKAAGKTIFRAIQAGFLPAGEAAQVLSERMNTVGLTAQEAASEVESLAMMARKTGAIQMEDFVAAVRETSGAVNALVTDQKDLGKVMGFLVKQGKELDQTYQRRANAAKDLTKTLSANYDIGFATLDVQSELGAVIRAGERGGKLSKNMGKQAAEIQRMLNAGQITSVTAARMLKEIGGTTTTEVQAERLRRTAIDVIDRGVEYAQARAGELTYDQIEILKKVGLVAKSGGDLESIIERAGLTKAERKTFMSVSDQIAKRQYKGKGLMDTTIDEFFTSMGRLMSPLLEMLPGVLNDIRTTLDMITSSSWFKSMFGAKSKEELRKERERLEKESQIRGGAGSISGLLSRITKEEVPWYQTDEAFDSEQVIRLIKDKSLQEKYASTYHRPFTKLEKMAIMKAGAELGDSRAEEMIKSFEERFTPKKVKVHNGQTKPNGTNTGKVTVEYEQSGAADTARQQNSRENEAVNSSGRQSPAR